MTFHLSTGNIITVVIVIAAIIIAMSLQGTFWIRRIDQKMAANPNRTRLFSGEPGPPPIWAKKLMIRS